MNFSLEPWKKEYAKDIAEVANNPKIADKLRNVFPNPYTLADAEWYINDCIEKSVGNNQICLAIVIDGKAVGSIGIFVRSDVYCKNGELGYWLGEEYWDKGVMTEAIKQICKMAFKKLDIVRIYAEPFAHNKGSRRVLEKSGFTQEGYLKNSVFKNGQLYDSCIYSLLK